MNTHTQRTNETSDCGAQSKDFTKSSKHKMCESEQKSSPIDQAKFIYKSM